MKHAKAKLAFLGVVIVLGAAAVFGVRQFSDTESEFEKVLEQDGEWAWHGEQQTGNQSHVAALEQRWRQWRLEAAFKKFLDNHPDHAQAMVAYGNLLYDLGRQDEAIRWWEKAIVADPRMAVAYNNLANHYSEFGRAADGLRMYQKAIDLDPNNPVFRCNWATTCCLFRTDAQKVYGWDTKEIFRQSLEQYRKARELSPDNYTYASTYAETFFMAPQPDWEEAYAAWQFCLNLTLDNETRQRVFAHIALVCMKMKRLDEAKTWIEKIDAPEVQGLRQVRERKLSQLLVAQNAPAPIAAIMPTVPDSVGK